MLFDIELDVLTVLKTIRAFWRKEPWQLWSFAKTDGYCRFMKKREKGKGKLYFWHSTLFFTVLYYLICLYDARWLAFQISKPQSILIKDWFNAMGVRKSQWWKKRESTKYFFPFWRNVQIFGRPKSTVLIIFM